MTVEWHRQRSLADGTGAIMSDALAPRCWSAHSGACRELRTTRLQRRQRARFQRPRRARFQRSRRARFQCRTTPCRSRIGRRYFLEQGVSDGALASTNGVLPLDITDTTGGLQAESLAIGRGLRFIQLGGDARACQAISSPLVFEALEGSTTGTIEVVADITAGVSGRSRLAAIGVGGLWSFAVGYSSGDTSFILLHE